MISVLRWACLLFITSAPFAQAADFRYTVIKVSDGDTLTATDGHLKFKVRLAGLDAPESAQPFGKVAAGELRRLVLNQSVAIDPVGNGLDAYNRVLAKVLLGNVDVSQALIANGFAYYYRPGCKEYPENARAYDYDPRPYVEAEKLAKSQKLNLWASSGQELPCSYRKKAHR